MWKEWNYVQCPHQNPHLIHRDGIMQFNETYINDTAWLMGYELCLWWSIAFRTARIAHELWCLKLDRQQCSQMACFDSAALEMMLMDRWVINPPRIKIFSVNQVTHLLNGRSRISKHNFSIPTPYWHENTKGESNFAAHSMTKTRSTGLSTILDHRCTELFKKWRRGDGGEKEWQKHGDWSLEEVWGQIRAVAKSVLSLGTSSN